MDRTALEMYVLANRLARRVYGRDGKAWRDRERGWTGDRCCVGRETHGVRHCLLRRADWWEIVKALRGEAAA